jgi:hypothetical protein
MSEHSTTIRDVGALAVARSGRAKRGILVDALASGRSVRHMASRWASISDRIRFSPQVQGPTGWRGRPIGEASGRWIAVGPVWVRLGSRSSWQGEDEDTEMIKPVQP